MNAFHAMLLAGTVVLLAGCTQPNGMPDPTQGDDPDNLFYDDEYDLAVLTGILAVAVAVIGVRTLPTRRHTL